MTNNEQTATEKLPLLIEKMLRKSVEELVQQEAASAGYRVEQAIRAKTAEIAATVLQNWSMHFRDTKLVIEVEFKNLQPQPKP